MVKGLTQVISNDKFVQRLNYNELRFNPGETFAYSDTIPEHSDLTANPEFCVIDTILESRPDIILMLKSDIIGREIFNF